VYVELFELLAELDKLRQKRSELLVDIPHRGLVEGLHLVAQAAQDYPHDPRLQDAQKAIDVFQERAEEVLRVYNEPTRPTAEEQTCC
jgi:hypothetical protein